LQNYGSGAVGFVKALDIPKAYLGVNHEFADGINTATTLTLINNLSVYQRVAHFALQLQAEERGVLALALQC